jgi:hypothetical protein
LAPKVYEELFLRIRQLSVFKAELFSAGIADAVLLTCRAWALLEGSEPTVVTGSIG